MRAATPTSSAPPTVVGNPDAALAGAAKVVEADYEVPFQGHTSIGPAHAMADPSNDQMTIYSNDMKSYGLRNGVAAVPADAARSRPRRLDGRPAGATAARRPTMRGSRRRFWRRRSAGRCACSGCARKKPRGTPRARRYAVKMRGGLDAQGNLVALDYEARAADHNHLGYNEPDTVLIAQLTGMRQRDAGARRRGHAVGHVRDSRTGAWPTHVVGLPLVWETPLRTGNLRDPNGPQVTFASESFIDELAAAAKADPVEFRLKLLTASTDDDSGFKRARSIAVRQGGGRGVRLGRAAVAEAASARGDILTGRGIAYAFRSQTVVAQIAEVEVNRRTGHVWVKRFVCAHDCGLVINPEALRRTIEGGMLHSLSRALHEEVRVRHREGDERGLGVVSDADARRHARARSTSCS